MRMQQQNLQLSIEDFNTPLTTQLLDKNFKDTELNSTINQQDLNLQNTLLNNKRIHSFQMPINIHQDTPYSRS